MSQLSQSSTASEESNREREKRKGAIIDEALSSYKNKQSREIDSLNRSVAKIVKDRDSRVKEIEASSLDIYDQAVMAATSYFNESQTTAVDLCTEVLSQMNKLCHAIVVGLEKESQLIDTDDAEEVASDLAKKYADGILQRNRWRRRVVKSNYNELKKQQASVQDAINAEEVAKAAMVMMKANLI